MNLLTKINRKIFKFFHPQLGVILMLHRVIDQRSELKINRDIEITPDFLEETLKIYITKGYRFLSLDELPQIMAKPFWKIQKRFVCITFDDGYRDNYEVAYPILKKYNCPFTIYVTTDFYEYKANLWWYVLDDLLMKHNQLVLSDGTQYNTASISDKNEAFKAIHVRLSQLKPQLLRETFDNWFSAYNYSFEEKVKALSMTSNQIKEISKDSLCSIGSHTITHPRLANMSADEQEVELKVSKVKLERLIEKNVMHFAYPFGNHNADSIQLAESCGYETAVIAWGGVVRKNQDKWKLTREILKQ